MNTYQLAQLPPPQIETFIYTDSNSTDLEIALSVKLLELYQYSVDTDKQLETAIEERDQFETDLDNEVERIENKLDTACEYLYELAEMVNIYENDDYSDLTDKERLGYITDHLKKAKSKDII